MSSQIKRRDFILRISAGVAGTGMLMSAPAIAGLSSMKARKIFPGGSPNVALVRGHNRKTNMYDALKLIEKDIRKSINGRQVVIKPNFTLVREDQWLASTHVDNIEALLEVITPFYKRKVIIAEGTGGAEPLEVPLMNFNYLKLKEKYNVEFYDLRNDKYSMINLMDSNIQPMPIRTSSLLTDPDVYLVSAAVMKTHNLAVVTLGLKNIVLAAPMNTGEDKNDRSKLHSDPVAKDPRYFNYNMYLMAQHTYPDLVMIDGFIGMEGKGPLVGDPIEARVAIAGTDCIATDRIGTEVMGHDFNDVGHLVHCANAGMGEGDITRINVLGDKVSACRRDFRKTDDWDKIRRWK
jgi:uncharacterized protein (DUF362 family)